MSAMAMAVSTVVRFWWFFFVVRSTQYAVRSTQYAVQKDVCAVRSSNAITQGARGPLVATNSEHTYLSSQDRPLGPSRKQPLATLAPV